jgi:hypothetical protein
MNLMLVLIFSCVTLGLVVPRIGPRQTLLVAAMATVVTVLYYASQRFM